ncbi:hypothetical protein BDZ89DRAFT_363848 [Hymenopellis radicata]|nr:hypothetical protein BDZ89DRAFT_363848 [Hymenopellis radicata]
MSRLLRPCPSERTPPSTTMTRGRKKDMTIPTTRALTQQRDYRARRAQYVSDLEEKCRALESENDSLRQEVRTLRIKLPATTVHNPAVVETSSQLMHDLSAVTETLSRFQHLVFAEANTFPPPMPMLHAPQRGGQMPSPVSSAASPACSDTRATHAAPRFPRDILCSGHDTSMSVDGMSPSYDDDDDGRSDDSGDRSDSRNSQSIRSHQSVAHRIQ